MAGLMEELTEFEFPLTSTQLKRATCFFSTRLRYRCFVLSDPKRQKKRAPTLGAHLAFEI
jgi:hypothetical protein